MTDKEIEQSVAELVQESGLENFTVKGKTLAHWFAICENYIQRLKSENEELRKVNDAMGLAINCFGNKEENDE